MPTTRVHIAMHEPLVGDADEVLNSIANFNTVLRACGLESVEYMDEDGSAEDEVDLGTLVQRLVAKTTRSSRRCELSRGVLLRLNRRGATSSIQNNSVVLSNFARYPGFTVWEIAKRKLSKVPGCGCCQLGHVTTTTTRAGQAQKKVQSCLHGS